ncbi:MAG: mechanosensitive ion channel family protein [Caldilineaceae bacterium]
MGYVLLFFAFLLLGNCLVRPQSAHAQAGVESTPTVDSSEDLLPATAQVDVQPTARDDEIAQRLSDILQSTEWFQAPSVSVRNGVVFLDGSTARAEYRTWAGDVARQTQDVVAVVNRIQVTERSPWDFSPAIAELQRLVRNTIQLIPLLIFALITLVLAWYAMRATAQIAQHLLKRQVANAFLRNLVATTISIPIFLLGLYLVLQVAGLTRLAVTVLGGTGVAGLIIGIAFRDIMENFLATILISTRNPFRAGDRITCAGHLGIVQQVTSRTTVLMSLEGNYIQIPNAIVYKSTIINYTANPKQRLDFLVGIGYEDVIVDAQATIIDVLSNHPAVLRQPEPLALVENLGSATINIRVYLWFDASQYEERKVRSAAIRLVKRALDEGGFSMPDEAREIIFPKAVPIQWLDQPTPAPEPTQAPQRPERFSESATDPPATAAEGGLQNEDEQIQEQARQARTPEEDTNLLKEN